MVIAEETMQFATTNQCFWLLDVIASYQHQLPVKDFQVWTLKKHTRTSARIIAEDSQGNVLLKQTIKHTHFEATETTVRVYGKLMLLDSEA